MSQDILLLHGALGSRRQLDDLSEALSSSFNVRTINLPGHGGRNLPEAYSMDLFVNDLADLLERPGAKPTDIFGFSMGGYVAILLAMKRPELVKRIMTLGTKFDWTPETADRETLLLNPDKMMEKVPDFAAMLAKRHAPQDWRMVVRMTADLLHRFGHGEALTMSKFSIPHEVRITRGELDHMVSENESMYVANVLENGSYESFVGFRHPLEQVDVKQLSTRIRSFFLQDGFM